MRSDKRARAEQINTSNQNKMTEHVRNLRWYGAKHWLALMVVAVAIIAVSVAGFLPGGTAKAATSSTINFQARLMTGAGAIATDGYYNVEFKLYDASSGGSPAWTETYYDSNGVTAGNDNRVRVANGYLTVNLGSQTAFSGVNWDQEYWITMNIGDTTQTATPTWDGEMSPRLKMTAVPYAFSAGRLSQYVTGNTATLSFASSIGQATTITLPDPGVTGVGTVCYQGSSACGFVSGSATNFIQNGTGPQTNANFNIRSASTGSVTGVLQGANGQTADLFNVQTYNGTTSSTVFGVDKDGNLAVQTVNVAANKNIVLSSGTGTYTQTYSNTTGVAATFNVTDSASSGATTVQGVAINLTGTANAGGTNSISGLVFGNVATATNNAFHGIDFGTGYDDLLRYNGNPLISGGGKVQNAAIDSLLTYSNLQKVGSLNTGSITTGFGTISTNNDITTTTAMQGGTATFTGPNALTLGTTGTNTGAILFKGSTAASGTLTLRGPNNPSTFTLSIPAITADANICTDNSVCTGYAATPASGNYLQQVPTSNVANAVGANIISPSAASIVALTVNGTSNATGATALVVGQSQSNDAVNVNVTGGSQTNGILVDRTNAGTLMNAVNITNTSGTVTNGISFSGTIGTDISRGTGTLTIQGAAVSMTTPVASGATGAITIQSGNSSTNTAGNIIIDTGTTSTGTPTVQLGNTNAKAVAVGNTGATISIQGNTTNTGTGAVSIQAASGGIITLGTTNNNQLTLGGSSSVVKLGSLGASTTAAIAVCRDSSTTNFIACDSGTGDGTPWLQGGNSFNTTGVLGTKDAQSLRIITSNTARATFDTSNNLYLGNGATAAAPNDFSVLGTGSTTGGTRGGQLTIQGGAGASGGSAGGDVVIASGNAAGAGNNAGGVVKLQGGNKTNSGAAGGVLVKNSADSTAAFQVQMAGSTSAVFTVDSSNRRLGVNTATPGSLLDVYQNPTAPGTVSNSASSANVTGSSTTFLTTFQPGDTFTITSSSNTCTVQQITSDTALVCRSTLASSSSGSAYSFTQQSRLSVADNGRAILSGMLTVTNPYAGRQLNLRVDPADGKSKIGTAAFGNTSTGTGIDLGNSTFVGVSRYNSGPGGTVDSVYVYFPVVAASPNNHARAVIYSNNGTNPNALMSSATAPTTVVTAATWTKLSLGATVTLAPNTTYWIGFKVDSDSTQYGNTGGASGDSRYDTESYASNFPGTFTSDASSNALYSIYAPYITTTDQSAVKGAINIDDNNGVIIRPNYNQDAVSGQSAPFEVQRADGVTVLQVNTSSQSAWVSGFMSVGTAINNNYRLNVEGSGTNGLIRGYRVTSTAGDSLLDLLSDVGGTASTKLTVSAAGVLTLAGGQTKDITTPTTGAANALTIGPGSSSNSNATGANATLGAGDATSTTCGTACTGGNLVLQGGSATGASGTTRNGGNVTINAGTGATSNGQINVGTLTNTNTINVGNATIADTFTGTINIGTNAAGSTGKTAITVGSTNAASSLLLRSGTGNITLNTAGTVRATFNNSNSLYLGNGVTNAAPTDFTVQGAGSSTSGTTGGKLTVSGGAATVGNANGGQLALSGGAGFGTGVQGLVTIAPATFIASGTTQTFNGGSGCPTCSVTGVDSFSTIAISASVASLSISIPVPAAINQVVGRVLYVTAASGSQDFTIVLGGTSIAINMKANSTATLIWNGAGWTAAGASSSTDLQSAYNNTLASAGAAELVLNPAGGNADGLTIRNNGTTPIVGGLLEVQTSVGSNLFSVNNNATEYANNGGAESSTFTMWTAITAGTVSRYVASDSNVATGTASVFVDGSSTANTGVKNTLAAALTPNLKYTVSFAVRHTSTTSTFTTMDVNYSNDGSAVSSSCATGQTVTNGRWTRINCSFTAPSSGITSSNAIFIRHSDGSDHDMYIDNLSVTVAADVNHAADGSVSAALGSNWTAFGAGTTVTLESSNIYDTSGSVKVDTTNNTDRGVVNNLAITPAINTQYLVTFYAKLASGTFTDIRVRYSRDGGTNFASCVDYNTRTLSTAGFTKITCLVTTDGTTATNADLIIDQPTAPGSTRTFYVDALSVTLNTNTASNVQIGGGNEGGPATLFTLDRSNGAPIADNNDAYLGSMYYDTSSGRIQCYEADGWGACGAAPDNIVNLNPEYAGAVLNGTGIGTMTADFCANQSGVLQVNHTPSPTAPCSTAGDVKNYYKWTSPQATQQTYSIYVTYQLPATFNGFSSDDTVQLVGRVSDTTNAAVTYQMYYKTAAGSLTQCWNSVTSETTVASSNNTWQSVGINGNESTGCSLNSTAANGFIIFKINLKANSGASAYASTLSFTTTGR